MQHQIIPIIAVHIELGLRGRSTINLIKVSDNVFFYSIISEIDTER